jgi:hypothetical protein
MAVRSGGRVAGAMRGSTPTGSNVRTRLRHTCETSAKNVGPLLALTPADGAVGHDPLAGAREPDS